MKETIQIFSSVEKLADFFAGMLSESISRTAGDHFFYIALSGGSTPRAVFKSIAENYKDKIDWSKVKIFWGDERCVAPESDESNYKMAQENLFNTLALALTQAFSNQKLNGTVALAANVLTGA